MDLTSATPAFRAATDRRLRWLVFLTAIGLSLVWWLPKLTAAGNPFDEALLLVYPELILRGEVMHRDFQAYYGPANLWMLAGVYHFTGISLTVERIVGLLERVALLTLLGWLALRLNRQATVAVLVAGILVLSPLALIALAWIPAVIFSLAGLLVASRVRDESTLASVAGLLMAFSLQFRPDAGPAVLLASAVFWLAWSRKNRIAALAGFLAGNLPMLVHLILATPQSVWNNLIYFPLFVVKDGRIIHWADVKPFVQSLIWLYAALALANIGTGIILWRKNRRDPVSLLYLSAALLGTGLAHQVIQRCDLAHLAMGSLITFPLGAITVHFWLRRWLPAKLQKLTMPIGALFCAAIFLGFAHEYFRQFVVPQISELFRKPVPAKVIVNGDRNFPLDPPAAQFHAARVVDFINGRSSQGDRIFVGPGDLRRTFYSDLYFYYLLLPKVEPSGYFLELNPLLTNSETSGIDEQILRSRWVLLNQIYDQFHENNRSSELGSERPVIALQNHFHEVFRSGPFLVYEKNR